MNSKIVNYNGREYLVNEKEGYVKLISSNKNIISKCNPKDEFDEDFGIKLTECRLLNNKKLEHQLIKEKYKSNSNTVEVRIKETTELMHSNMKEIFGFNLPKIQNSEIKLEVSVNNNIIRCDLEYIGLVHTKSHGECNILECTNGSLMKGVFIAELRARKQLCDNIEKIMRL